MPVTHQLIFNSNFSSINSSSSLRCDTPIAIIGIAESATFPINSIQRIQKESDLTLLGGTTDNTLLPEIKILQEYGCNNIFIIRVTKGVDGAATETNIIGTETTVKTGLGLFKDCFSNFRVTPELLLIPGLSSAAVITKGIEVCNNLDAFLYSDFPLGTTLAQATTIRGTSTGLGTKSSRLIPCLPRLKRGNDFESLATHTVGLVSKTVFMKGFGFAYSNELFSLGITGIESGFTLSYTDINSDNQKLENLGISSVNLSLDGYVAWGNRNALFVNGSVENIETYSVIQRIKQKLNNILTWTASRFIDEDCSFSTAKLLETALNNVIISNSSKGNLRNNSRAVFNENLSDLINQRRLVYDVFISSNLSIEIVNLTTQFSINL